MHLVNRRVLVVVGGWLAAAVVALLAGVFGIRLVGESLTGTPGGVLSEEDVDRALAAAPALSTPPSPSPSPSSTASASPPTDRSFSTPGGTAVARCVNGEAFLRTWNARPGYQVHNPDQGPDDEVEVTFRGEGGEYELEIACRDGIPYVLPSDHD